MNQILTFILFTVLLLTNSAHTTPKRSLSLGSVQVQQQSLIDWISWEEAMKYYSKEKKKILVSVHRKDCSWCKKMDRDTYGDPQIAKYINQNFYAVKFDAEQIKEVKKGDKTYKTVRKSGNNVHEFTAYLTMGQMSTPTTVFFDENLELLQPLPGYKKKDQFEIILTYFGGDHYLRIPWSRYKQEFASMKD